MPAVNLYVQPLCSLIASGPPGPKRCACQKPPGTYMRQLCLMHGRVPVQHSHHFNASLTLARVS